MQDQRSNEMQNAVLSRIPHNQLRLSSGSTVVSKREITVYPQTGNKGYKPGENVIFEIGSSSKHVFWDPASSYMMCKIKLLKNDGTVPTADQLKADALIWHGPHTLINSLTVSHTTSRSQIENLISADIVGQVATIFLPDAVRKTKAKQYGLFLKSLELKADITSAVAGSTVTDNVLAPSASLLQNSNYLTAGAGIAFNAAELTEMRASLLSGRKLIVNLPSDFLVGGYNNGSLIPLYYCPITIEMVLNSFGRAFSGNGTNTNSYEVSFEYHLRTYTVSQESVSEMESLILAANPGLSIDFPRLSVFSTNIPASQSSFSYQLPSQKINSLEKIFVVFTDGLAGENLARDPYHFLNGSYQDQPDGFISSVQLIIGDMLVPSQPLKCDVNGDYGDMYRFSSSVMSDGDANFDEIHDDDVARYYNGLDAGVQRNCLNSRFFLGFDLRRGSSLLQGINCSSTPVQLLLTLGRNRPMQMYVLLQYSATMIIARDGFTVKY